ncbi:hypothetical protein BUE80_DR001724, partial [Diplocarpon rosae]
SLFKHHSSCLVVLQPTVPINQAFPDQNLNLEQHTRSSIMRYSIIAASIVSLFAAGISAGESVECQGYRFYGPLDLLAKCNMYDVEENNAHEANCGWGVLQWSKGSDGFGKITMKNFNQKTLYFGFKTIGDNGQSRFYGYALDPATNCTEDLDPRYEVSDVSADLAP